MQVLLILVSLLSLCCLLLLRSLCIEYCLPIGFFLGLIVLCPERAVSSSSEGQYYFRSRPPPSANPRRVCILLSVILIWPVGWVSAEAASKPERGAGDANKKRKKIRAVLLQPAGVLYVQEFHGEDFCFCLGMDM